MRPQRRLNRSLRASSKAVEQDLAVLGDVDRKTWGSIIMGRTVAHQSIAGQLRADEVHQGVQVVVRIIASPPLQ